MVFWVRILYYRDRKISPRSALWAAAAICTICSEEEHAMMKPISVWKQELSGGAHAARLAALYCCAPEQTPAQAARYEAVLDEIGRAHV